GPSAPGLAPARMVPLRQSRAALSAGGADGADALQSVSIISELLLKQAFALEKMNSKGARRNAKMSASLSRREFVSGVSGAAIAAGLTEWTEIEEQSQARIVIDAERKHATIDRRLFGSFIEHLGRAVYEGIYDPGNKLSDSKGFRKDVTEE